MVEDTLGVLYFGIEGGIAAYDGTEWNNFILSPDVIRTLFKDSHGDIWYGSVNDFGRVKRSSSEGIRLESVAGEFPAEMRQFGDLWSISEADSTIFFQSGETVFTISSSGRKAAYSIKETYHRGISGGGRYFVNSKGTGLLQFTGEDFAPAPGGSFFREKTISGAAEIHADTLLVGTRDEGVFIWVPGTGYVQPFIFADNAADSFLKKNRIYHMTLLPDGTIAFATLLNGTLITDRNGRILKILHYHSGVQDNAHYYLGLSHDNNLWMCTGNGISAYNIFSPFSNWDYSKGVEGVVMCITGHMGGILVGTLTGLFFLPDPGTAGTEVKRVLDSEVWDIYPLRGADGKTRMVISAGNGLWLLDGMHLINVFSGELILKSYTLKRDSSWLLSFSANELHVSRVTQNSVIPHRTLEGLFSEYRSSAQESDKYLWVGTRSLRMNRISQGEIISAMADNEPFEAEKTENFTFTALTDVHCVNGRIIFSNSQGFMSYDSISRSFGPCRSLGPEAAVYNKMVSVMTPDPQGNIWIGGNELLLNRQDGTYSLYLLPFDPVRDIFSAFAFYHDKEGKTWIGGNKGLYLYDKSVIDPAGHMLPVIINSVAKDDSVQYVTAVSCPGSDVAAVVFENGRNITISYSLPSYTGDNAKEYSWKLQGYSEEWSRWSIQHFASFNSLPPGSYLFNVKGRTPGHESEVSCIRIIIERPWYGSIAARFIYVAAIVALLYAVNSISIRRRLRRELLTENIIQQRVRQSITGSLQGVTAMPDINEIPVIAESTDTESHTSFTESTGNDGRDTLFMNHLLDTIDQYIDDCDLSVERLCSIMNMSQTMLYRKLKAYTGLSITGFIRKVRLKKAAQMLLQTPLSVSEVAYRVGFNDPGYFSRCFREEFGLSPRDFQKTSGSANPS
jgi:AraC-like DNA-binding protein/ligand-binding sensor domain-containing protein